MLDLAAGVTGAAALAFALGTPRYGAWSTTLFGHAPVAALLILFTWGIWRGTRTEAGHPPGLGSARHW